MQDQRPVFLNLLQFRFPVPAVMSVAHRASGVLMVLVIPALVYLLDLSLASEQGFQQVRELLGNGWVRLFLILLAWGLMHHLFAGIRYLCLDFDLGIEKAQGRFTAWVVLIAAVVVAAIFGGWLYL